MTQLENARKKIAQYQNEEAEEILFKCEYLIGKAKEILNTYALATEFGYELAREDKIIREKAQLIADPKTLDEIMLRLKTPPEQHLPFEDWEEIK